MISRITKWLILSCSINGAASFALDKVSVISPHRKSIQNEFIPAFEKYYFEKFKRKVDVEWLDQGGTESNLRFVSSRFAKTPKSTGIDVFWGGGDMTFIDLETDGFLQPIKLSKSLEQQLPKSAIGIPLRSKTNSWYATALSSFGIFYNKRLLAFQSLPEPKYWQDLANKAFYDNISVADPRRSSSSLLMNIIILKALGWEEGWKTLTGIAGNTKKFTHSSSDPIKAIVSGDAALATAIDFYANAKIADLGFNNLGFILPAGQTIFNSDPIALLKGAPNPKPAQAFIEYVLSDEAQKLFFLAKGQKNGPKQTTLGRMAVNAQSYKEAKTSGFKGIIPFELPESKMKLNMQEIARIKKIFSDLIGAIHVDTHDDLKDAWKVIRKSDSFAKKFKEISTPPITEKEMMTLLEKWDDNLFRNQKINEWVKASQKKYKKLASKNNS